MSAVVSGGLSAESIAVSADGSLLAALSMRTSRQLKTDPIYNPKAGVSLYSINRKTGELTLKKEVLFDAVIPQSIVFDPSGNQLYIGVNEYDGETTLLKGAVEVWNVTGGNSPSLQRTNQRFRAPRGVHTLALVP